MAQRFAKRQLLSAVLSYQYYTIECTWNNIFRLVDNDSQSSRWMKLFEVVYCGSRARLSRRSPATVMRV
jgi:hypothetical protein